MKPLALVLSLLIARISAAQIVGHAPESSPYLDIEDPRNLSFYGGYLLAPYTPGHVNPHSGPLAGVRWDIHLGGPAYFEARWAHVFTDHDVTFPDQPPAIRDHGTKPTQLNLVDVGVVLSLVGERTWHHLIPVINAGFGLATDLGAARDSARFRFGTQFQLTAGGGIRWVPGGPIQVRVDVADYFYATRYPTSFRGAVGANNAVIKPTQALTAWRQNIAPTLGLSFTAFR
jgi:hypothetical protein